MKNQCEMLLDYMLAHGSVTGMESIVELGVMNYKGRISDLRRLGYDIRTVYEVGENRHGEPTRYARYYLRGTP